MCMLMLWIYFQVSRVTDHYLQAEQRHSGGGGGGGVASRLAVGVLETPLSVLLGRIPERRAWRVQSCLKAAAFADWTAGVVCCSHTRWEGGRAGGVS